MKDVLDLAKKLIVVQSVGGNTQALNEVLEICGKILKDYQFKELKKNGSCSRIYYNTKLSPKKFRLILNAHLDVVPAKTEQFRPLIKGDKLYGRGTQDMKAAAGVFVLLFRELAKNLSYPIGLQLVTDEEVGGFSGTEFQISKGVIADFVIAGEPTDMYINNEAKGVLWVEFIVIGKSSHAAYIWNGDNAVVKTTTLINFLLKHFPSPQIEKWQTTCNIAKIETTNDAVNKVPDQCRLVVDIRYVPQDLKRVESVIAACKNSFTSVRYIEHGEASFTNKNNKDMWFLKKTLKKHQQSADFIKKHGSSDIRFYNSRGMRGITFGPVGGGLHSDNEWVSLDSLSIFYNVMRDFLINVIE